MTMEPTTYGTVLLAAGASTRMGSPKQLLEYQGTPLLRHAVEVAAASRAGRVIVVLGAHEEALRPVLDCLGEKVRVVVNPRWAGGMGTSIQTGLAAAMEEGLAGVLLTLADQPLITTEILDHLVATHEQTGQPIVASAYEGTVGVPVFFAASHYPALMALPPAQGCKGVILRYADEAVHCDCPAAAIDWDTPADVARMPA